MMTKRFVLDFEDHDAAKQLFDDAFKNPSVEYIVTPTDVPTAREWMRKHAWRKLFSWVPANAKPMYIGQVIHLDDLSGRDNCGWCSDDAYLCDAPANKGEDYVCSDTGKRLCMPYNCPVAYQLDVAGIREHYPGLYTSDYQDACDDNETDWMMLHTRPRNACVENVTVVGIDTTDSKGKPS